MDKIEFVIQTVRNIVWGLALYGLLAIVIGVLIFIYPDLLEILVGTLLVISGIGSGVLAAKLNKYSKVKIDL